MSTRPFLAFACAHMTDERLYTHQIEALCANPRLQGVRLP